MDENRTAAQLLKTIWDILKTATQLAVTGISEAIDKHQEAKQNQPGEVSLKQLRKAGKEEIVVDVNKEAIDIFKDKAKNLGVQFAVKEGKDNFKVVGKHEQLNLVQDALNDTRKELMAQAKDKGDLQAQFNIATETVYSLKQELKDVLKELSEVKKELAQMKDIRNEMTITSLDKQIEKAVEKTASQPKKDVRTANLELSMSR